MDKVKNENGNQEAAESRDKMVLDSLIVVVGFGLCRSWIICCLVAPLGGETHSITNWVYLIFGALAALVVVLILKLFKNHVQHIRLLLFWVTGAALALSALMILFSVAQRFEPLLLCGFVIGGAGAGILQMLWGECFAHYEIRFATVVAPAAAIVTAVFTSLTTLSFEAVSIGYSAFPALSFVFLFLISKRNNIKIASIKTCIVRMRQAEVAEEVRAAVQPRQRPFISNAAKLMFSIMVFSFLCRVFDYMPINAPDPFAVFGGSALMSLVIVGAIFLLLGVLFKDRFNPMLTYRLSLPIMVAGLIAIALLFDTHAAFSILLINIGYEFFDILSWILFTEISRKEGGQSLRVFGFGVACMFVGMASGLMCGEMLRELIVSGDLQITVIALLSIFSLVVIAFLVIPEGTIEHLISAISSTNSAHPAGQKEETQEAPQEATQAQAAVHDGAAPVSSDNPALGRHEEGCALVSAEYRLTPRESEVLILLAYGRTLSIVARDLVIAKGTARTHIENIYRKLGVHKQQELIDLVEDFSLR